MRQRAPKLDKHVDKDVVLCSTTNRRVSNHTTDILLQDAIPFTKNWKRIPFYKREEYRGADQICVFSQSFAFKCDIGLVGIGADYVTTCIL